MSRVSLLRVEAQEIETWKGGKSGKGTVFYHECYTYYYTHVYVYVEETVKDKSSWRENVIRLSDDIVFLAESKMKLRKVDKYY